MRKRNLSMNNKEVSNYVSHEVSQLRKGMLQEIYNTGDKLAGYSDSEKRGILNRYSQAFENHFLRWITAASIYCSSDQSREILIENLETEIEEDHQGMLRDFTKANSVNARYYANQRLVIKHINSSIFDRKSGLEVVAFVGALENLSLDFIPVLAKISRTPEHPYILSHGEADVKHSKALKKAIVYEALEYNKNNNMNIPDDIDSYGAFDLYTGTEIKRGFRHARVLLEHIF